jgi:predicted component of type VI protein secretion system
MADSPASIASIRLVLSGAELVLGQGEHILGRSAECSVRVDDPLTSRHHAAIAVCAEGVTVRDLGSRNGVLVNGEEIDKVRTLAEGDLITVGSQALTVLQICRAGAAPAVRGAPRMAALGKIAVTRRAVPADEAYAAQAATTTLGTTNAPFGRPIAAFRLIVEAAERAIATGRVERAEKILQDPLVEVLTTLREGSEVEHEIVEIAVQQALSLAEATRRPRWLDYVRDVYSELRMSVPAAVADRIAKAAKQAK